jgi:hypothetical protein
MLSLCAVFAGTGAAGAVVVLTASIAGGLLAQRGQASRAATPADHQD